MPLVRSSSKSAFTRNLKAELRAGRPRNQALAIAYSIQRTAQGKGESPMAKKKRKKARKTTKRRKARKTTTKRRKARKGGKRKARKSTKRKGRKRTRRTPKWSAATRASYKAAKRALIRKYNGK